jgi:hypothetical protein
MALKSSRIAGLRLRAGLLALGALVALPSMSWAALTRGGVTFPTKVRVGSEELRLNGAGLRQVTLFNIDVYAAALYVAEPTNDARAILDSPDTKRVDMSFLRNVRRKQIREAWNKSFRQNCEGDQCERLRPTLERLEAAVPDLRQGDRLQFTFGPQGVEIQLNGRTLEQVAGAEFARVLLATWIGRHPPSRSLRAELLGVAER